ncbi:MAG TPA: Pycsar system effector family protein [Actinoplanes sp.]|nr:Pycsar system effector family protein [Actinoplanes sp.]
MDEQQLAERLLHHNREEIDRADRKAVQGLAVAGTAAAAVLGLILGGGYSPGRLGTVQAWCWSGGSLLWVLGTVSLIAAVYPRLSGDRDVSLLAYFGHIATTDRDQLAESLKHATDRSLASVASELHWTSRIVITKYRFVRAGLAFLACSVIILTPLTF